MRPLLLPLLVLTLGGCTPAVPETPEAGSTDGAAAHVAVAAERGPPECRPAQPEAFPPDGEDPEPAVLAALGGRARRSDGGLHLTLAGGSEVVLRDEGDDSVNVDALVRHRLVAWHPTIRSYEVGVYYYEGRATLLVDGRSGHRTLLWGRPSVSTDRTRLIAASMDLAAGYDHNGLQVWRTDGDTLALEWEAELPWGPADPRWIDGETIAVRAHPVPWAQDTSSVCVFVRHLPTGWRADPVPGRLLAP